MCAILTFSAFFFNLTISSLLGIDPPSHPMAFERFKTSEMWKKSEKRRHKLNEVEVESSK